MATDWKSKLNQCIDGAAAGNIGVRQFAQANADAISSAVAGRGPDDTDTDPDAGARMVVNISSAHIPAFCNLSRANDPKPYKNGYDLKRYRIGDSAPGLALKTRELVDRALPLGRGKPENVYFGAVELNGSGIRFYGDVCLVLKRDALRDDTAVLDRNSYDLVRPPISQIIEQAAPNQDRARKDQALQLKGSWKADLGAMAAVKAFQVLVLRLRRSTTGQISEAVRDDEDYMEVLRIGSFRAADLQEARLSAAEAAHDALTGQRLLSRPAPRLEALIWRHRRRIAEQDLRRSGVPVRIVTTSGRTKD